MLASFYRQLEEKTPSPLKRLVPEKWRIWMGYQIKVAWNPSAKPVAQPDPPPVEASINQPLDFARPLHLPCGETEQSLKAYLSQFYIKEDGLHEERNYYLEAAFKRFLYTLQITPSRRGRLLEIGAAPYFISLLLKQFTPHELTFVNYFGEAWGKIARQTLVSADGSELLIESDNVNIEAESLPYQSASFDVVLLCEVLEHLTNDPHRALLEIKRVLKPNGTFILTTPNMACLENIERLWAGHNIFDNYSAYGPYGRHNREYTFAEVKRLLEHVGFAIEEAFTSDIHAHHSQGFIPSSQLATLIEQRPDKLGQYTFIRATNRHEPQRKKPAWLYRSYPSEEVA